MQDIENQAILTYQQNLQYFQQEQPELAKLLNIFEKAVETNNYTTQLELEYVNGYFDILDTQSNKFLYGMNSIEISSQLTNQLDHSKGKVSFEGIPTYQIPDDDLDNHPDLRNLSGIIRMMNYYRANTSKDTTMLKIEKLIFIGTGLGFHIPMIHQNIQGSEYLIIEDNLEIFKLSLFTTKYYELAQTASLTFAIAEDENMFLEKMDKYLRNNFFYNKYLKYSYFPSHSVEKIKQIQTAIATQSFLFFPYKAILFKSLKPLEFLNNGYKSINVDGNFSNSIFQEKPILLLAAGPSFKKNIEWIKANKDKFIIVAVSAVLNTLYKNDIVPDILTQLDGSHKTDIYYTNIDTDNFLKDTIFLCGANIRKNIRTKFNKKNIYYFDEGDFYIKNFGAIAYPCIGSMTLSLLLKFQAREIYLLGLDLAIDQETGATHSTDHDYVLETHFDKKDSLANEIEMERNLFAIQGNFKEVVYTNALLQSSVQALYRNILEIKKDEQNIYNLNEGAKIRTAIPTHIDTINMGMFLQIDKANLLENLKEVFNKNSIEELSQVDIDSIKKRLKNIKEIQAEIEKFEKSVSFKTKEEYLYELLGLVSLILHKKGREYLSITSIFLTYFKYALNIILDFFNTKETKKHTKHLQKFNKLLINEMHDICRLHIEKFEKFLKERT